MATATSVAPYTTETQPAAPEKRPAIVPRKSKCSESFHVHYSALTVLRDMQTVTSGGKNSFYGSVRGVTVRTGLHTSTVVVAIRILVKDGWLVREDKEWRRGQGRRFTVLTHDQWAEAQGRISCR